ncbi:alpha/beta hydrolase-fold protein [candidate division KSB1 bacterium]
MNKIVISAIIIVFSTFSNLFSQERQLVTIGEAVTIRSIILDEDRRIFISLPIGYSGSNREYPVFYLTDGHEYNFVNTAGMIRYFSNTYFPPMIVVGIPNTDRGRDLSVVVQEQLPGSGGAGKYIDFITDELIPYIDEKYRATDHRILAGFSAGGQVVVYALLKASAHFDSFIAGSPAIGFGGDYLLDLAEEFFKNRKTLRKSLFIPYFEEDFTVTPSYVQRLIDIIIENRPEGFNWNTKIYKGRGHVPANSSFEGLREVFKEWEPVTRPVIFPYGGELPEGSPIEIAIGDNSDPVFYTLDGTEPDMNSSIYTKPFTAKCPMTVKAKAIRKGLDESVVVSSVFTTGEPIQPVRTSGELQRGLEYKYFEKEWFRLPDSIDLTPVKTGIVNKLNLDSREKDTGYLFQFDGYLEIYTRGAYRLYLESNGISKLLINDRTVIENPVFNGFNEVSYDLFLEKGKHRIRVLYTNPWVYGNRLKLSYKGQGIPKMEIPPDVLFHNSGRD